MGKEVLFLFIFSGMLLTISIVIILQIQKRFNRLKAKKKQLQITLANILEERDNNLQQFFQTRVNTLKKLIELTYISSSNTEKYKKHFDLLLMNLSFKDEEWDLLKRGVNQSMNGILEYISIEYQELTEEDIKYCCLVCAGFTTQEIAILLHIDKESVYRKRNRIRLRLHLPKRMDLYEFLKTQSEKLKLKMAG